MRDDQGLHYQQQLEQQEYKEWLNSDDFVDFVNNLIIEILTEDNYEYAN